MGRWGCQDHQERKDPQVTQDHRGRRGLREPKGCQVSLALEDPWVIEDLKADGDPGVLTGWWVSVGAKERRALMDHQGRLVSRAIRESLGSLEKGDLRVFRVLLAPPVLQEIRGLQENRGPQVYQEPLDLLGTWG